MKRTIAELVWGGRDGQRLHVPTPPPPSITLPASGPPLITWDPMPLEVALVAQAMTETWVYQGTGVDNGIAYYTKHGDHAAARMALHRQGRRPKEGT